MDRPAGHPAKTPLASERPGWTQPGCGLPDHPSFSPTMTIEPIAHLPPRPAASLPKPSAKSAPQNTYSASSGEQCQEAIGRSISSHTCLTPWPVVGHVARRFSPVGLRLAGPHRCSVWVSVFVRDAVAGDQHLRADGASRSLLPAVPVHNLVEWHWSRSSGPGLQQRPGGRCHCVLLTSRFACQRSRFRAPAGHKIGKAERLRRSPTCQAVAGVFV